jgi:predicted permease
VLGFASAAAFATGILFGLAPALRATKLNLTAEFQGGARTLGAGSRSALAKTLMVIQVALSLVLLVGAGLFIQTLRNLQNVDVGFNREHLLLFQVNAAANGATGPQSLALYERLRERLATLPGVSRATFSRVPSLSQNNWNSGVTVPGYVQTALYESVQMNGLGNDYLATLELPLLRGRAFTAQDNTPDQPKVAVVNQAFAKRYFGTEDVVGRRFGLGRAKDAPEVEIVGLLRDAKYSDVRYAVEPSAFVPYSQLNSANAGTGHFVLRFSGGEAALTTAVRGAVREIDATLPVTNIRTQQQQIDRLFTQERLFASLCSVFGGLALALAAVGLYGLMSYAVLRRTGEIGLRMALGALPRGVLWMVVRESLGLVVLGVLLGIAAAAAATRWIESMLFGLSTTDPAAYGLGAALLLVVATVACLLPARRAARIDPMKALRTE